MRRAARVAAHGIDPEGVHALRVAAARLETWLWLSRVRVLRDDLRWLRRELGRARDLDVLPARIELALAAAWFYAERERAYADVRALLAGPRFAGLSRALSVLAAAAPDGPRALSRRLPALAERARRAGLRWAAAAHDGERLHALRKDLRRLRYALESLGRGAAELARVQDQLGRACELSAARGLVAEFRAAALVRPIANSLCALPGDETALALAEHEATLASEDARLALEGAEARAGALETWRAIAARLTGGTRAWTSR